MLRNVNIKIFINLKSMRQQLDTTGIAIIDKNHFSSLKGRCGMLFRKHRQRSYFSNTHLLTNYCKFCMIVLCLSPLRFLNIKKVRPFQISPAYLSTKQSCDLNAMIKNRLLNCPDKNQLFTFCC